jgi:hypothetical protein
MTNPANSPDKPSPADTPTERPEDNGGKSKVEKSDRKYHKDEPEQENIAKRYQNEEQPVQPVTEAPNE